MDIVQFLLVLIIGAVLLVLLDKASGTTYRGAGRQLIHVVAYGFWGAFLFASFH